MSTYIVGYIVKFRVNVRHKSQESLNVKLDMLSD